MNVVSPMILDSSGNVLRRIDPVDVSLDLQLEPLSSAEIELKPGDTIPERSWVSVYTEHGLAGIFRSRPQRDRYGERSSRVSLVHGAVELNDYLTTKGGDQEQDPANTAIAYIMQFYLGTHWRLGTVSATSSVVYQLNGSGVLDAITEIMEQLPGYMLVFDQSVTPWTLNVLPRPETVSAEGRLSRNISSVEISRDDSSLCTRVYYGENDLFVEDAAAIQKYGVIEYRISDSGLTNAQLAAIAQAYLDNHKTSKLSVSISAIDFYNATGEPIDRIALGSKYRLAIPDAETEENRVIEAIICSIHYDSVRSRNPQITLASDPDTIITFLKKQRRSGGSARQIAKEEADKQYQHWTTENEVYKESVYKILGVELNPDGTVKYVQAKDAQGNPIYDEQGNPVWETDSAGNPVPVYNEESEGSLGGSVKQTAQDLTSLYTETGVASLPAGVTNLFSYASTIKQTAESIQTEVTAARGTSSSLGDRMTTMASNINQQADKISLVVTSTTHEGQTTYSINTAGIIVAINGGGQGVSSTIISSDKIDLQGYVTADQIFATDTTIGQYLTANNAIFQTKVKTAALEATNGAIIESGLEVSDGSTLTGGVTVDSLTVGYPASSGYNLTKNILGGMVKDITLNSTTNVLTITKFNGDIINFSKAASPGNLTGSWSGAVYTVTNGSQNWTIDFDPTAASDATWATEIGTGTVNQNNSKWLDFPLYIGSYSQGGQMTHNVTISKSINATAVYTAGQDSVAYSFTTASSVPSGITPTDLVTGTLRRYHVTKDGTDVVDSYYRVPNYGATLASVSDQTTPPPTLSSGDYALYRTKDGANDGSPIAYYRVSSGGTGDVDVLKGAWTKTGNDYKCEFYPSSGNGSKKYVQINTSAYIPGATQQQITNSGAISVLDSYGGSYVGGLLVYVQQYNNYAYITTNSSTPSVTTNVLARVRLQGSDIAEPRNVKTISPVSLASDQTTTSDHTVTVTYDDNDTSSATVTVDASAITGVTQRIATNLENTIVLSTSDTSTVTKQNLIVNYDDDSSTNTFTVVINASAVYQQGRTDGAGQVVTGHITTLGTRVVDGSTQSYDPNTHKYTIHAYASGTNIDNEPYYQDITLQATRAYNQGAQESVTGFSYQGTAIGNVQDNHEDGTITVSALNGSTTLRSDTLGVYLVQGSWNSSNRKAVNIRMSDGSNTLIARTWVDAPSVSHNITAGSPVARVGSTGSRVYMGSITLSNLSTNSWISVPISCGGESKTFYIDIN